MRRTLFHRPFSQPQPAYVPPTDPTLSASYLSSLKAMSSSSLEGLTSARNAPPQAAQHLTPEAVASLPPPGLGGPTQIVFSPSSSRYIAYVSVQASNHARPRYNADSAPSVYRPLTSTPGQASSSSPDTTTASQQQQQQAATQLTAPTSNTSSTERILLCLDLESADKTPQPLLRWNTHSAPASMVSTTSGNVNTLRSVASLGSAFTAADRGGKRRLVDAPAMGEPAEQTLPQHNQPQTALSLEERLRRERQRISSSAGSLTQFSWIWWQEQQQQQQQDDSKIGSALSTPLLRLLVPARGNLFLQDGVLHQRRRDGELGTAYCIYDKSQKQQQQQQQQTGGSSAAAALDAQLSPDGSLVAWTADGEIFVQACRPNAFPVCITFGAQQNEQRCITHGVAEFVAQEEMDRYRGFWWHPDSQAILFTRTDESNVPIYRIMHHDLDSNETAPISSSSATTPASSSAAGLPSFPNSAPPSTAQSSTKPCTPSGSYEDHRYPFAGKENPQVRLGFVLIDRDSILRSVAAPDDRQQQDEENSMQVSSAQEIAAENWQRCVWFDPPREASEYLARLNWLPDGSAVAQWQNRTQSVLVLHRMDFRRSKGRTLLTERSDIWINLHHMFRVLDRPIHPEECMGLERNVPPIPQPLPAGSFSFLFASERSGYSHLYLYTFVPGINGEQAVLLRTVSSGEWMVEGILGVDQEKDVVYFLGTFDSPLERHLYALPLTGARWLEDEKHQHSDSVFHAAEEALASLHYNPNNGVRRGFTKVINALSGKTSRNRLYDSAAFTSRPARLTAESGMHSIVMSDDCQMFVDTSSDLNRPTTVKIFELNREGNVFAITNGVRARIPPRLIMILYDAALDEKSLASLKPANMMNGVDAATYLSMSLPPPELISIPTSDGSETLHAALYRPDPRCHGPGPYPLVCAVYGGPHVQRVNRSWSQCADMRAQRLRSLGFCVVKCDNRGSSRRGLAFESVIAKRLGRLEVLDQVAVVRFLVMRGIVDPTRVGVYGWSYGGYLATMCLFRAPDVFQVAVAGAPVTSWDGYDTHYTERYMGLPAENPSGYRESAVFDHVHNMRGKLMIVHGLIDENVHFRHTARLINKLIASGKDYDLLIFPEERHSPRRLRDRIYMEQRISEYFMRHLCLNKNAAPPESSAGNQGMRTIAGYL